jgi:signal transduction histidine kinase
MNQLSPPSSSCDVLTQREISNGAMFTADDLLHELRQPLSVIDSLAYYLELTCTDENAKPRLKQIQAMVNEASRIISRVPTY